jgi:hypothetical protein
MLKAFEVLEVMFHQKVDPSSWPFYTMVLAKNHETRGENSAAEICYHRALKSYMERSDVESFFRDRVDGLLDCHNGFGHFLIKTNRDEEALNMLINGLTNYLSHCWSLTNIQDSAPLVSWASLGFACSLFFDVMESLQRLHLKMDQDGSLAWARASISRVQNLCRKSYMVEPEQILLEFMTLAAAYSEIWRLDAAIMVYEFAAPLLEAFNTRPHAFERACAFRAYAQHYEKLGSPDDRSKKLQLAFRSIAAVHRYEESNEDYLLNFLESLDELSGITGFPGPGPNEDYFESMARQDPELSRWMR